MGTTVQRCIFSDKIAFLLFHFVFASFSTIKDVFLNQGFGIGLESTGFCKL